jgi:sulfite exporter TauE/SafE
MSRKISYFLIIIGGLVAIYAQAKAEQNQLILIAGIVILMLGVYNISRNIPSKTDQEDEHQNNL